MIVIFAPYGRNEVTAAAIRLADLITSWGLDVRFVSIDVHEQSIDPDWDTKVYSRHDWLTVRMADRVTHCVWFSVGERNLQLAKILYKQARQIVVPSWHSLRRDSLELLLGFDLIVCPGKLCHDLLKKKLHGNHTPSTGKIITWCRWDSGLDFTRHAGRADQQGGTQRLIVLCDSSVIDDSPLVALGVVAQLLDLVEDLQITLLCTKTWCKRNRRRVRILQEECSHRLTVLYQRTFAEQAQLFQQHDWLLIPGVRSDFGLTASRGLACGLPVICYDVAPYSELVIDNKSGILAKCESSVSNYVGSPIAVSTTSALMDACIAAFDSPQTLLTLQSSDWKLTERSCGFADGWSVILGVDSY